MITPVNPVPIGILGLGFLGKILSSELTSFEESWGTWHETPPPEPLIPVFHFDWADKIATKKYFFLHGGGWHILYIYI